MILISIGGNMIFDGMSPAICHARAVRRLADFGIHITRHSRFYQTPAWPDPGDPPFNNAVIAVRTDLSPQDLLQSLLAVEQEFGRTRSFKNAPRTLDLDLLTYDDVVMQSEDLVLPHPRLAERPFILQPLSDIAPGWTHPQNGQTVTAMLAGLDMAGIIPVLHPSVFLQAETLMGVVNVTPDSFSDGGKYHDQTAAIAHGKTLIEQGADILDIGGESTRPGAKPVTIEEEQRRILPVITALSGHRISVDTRHAATMRAALDAGADIINDVTALTHDPQAMHVVAEAQCPVILMHMQGMPDTMQDDPDYADVVAEVTNYLEQRIRACLCAGVMPWHIGIDPGIGFGKTLAHNLALLSNLDDIRREVAMPLLLGVSRKSFIEKICPGTPAEHRLPGSLAALHQGLAQGVEAYRVHDVGDSAQAIKVWQAIETAA